MMNEFSAPFASNFDSGVFDCGHATRVCFHSGLDQVNGVREQQFIHILFRKKKRRNFRCCYVYPSSRFPISTSPAGVALGRGFPFIFKQLPGRGRCPFLTIIIFCVQESERGRMWCTLTLEEVTQPSSQG